LRTLGAILNVKAYDLTFCQGFEAGALDSAEVYKHVCTAIVLGDEAKALGFVKPLNSTCSHVIFTFKNKLIERVVPTGNEEVYREVTGGELLKLPITISVATVTIGQSSGIS
jgi:hypothetical protein